MTDKKEQNTLDKYHTKIKGTLSLITLIALPIGGTILVLYSVMYGLFPLPDTKHICTQSHLYRHC